MRKLLMVAALAAAALGGAAACTQGTPTPTTTTTPPTTTAASSDDQTVAVCSEAISVETTNSAAALAKVDEAMQAAAAGQLDKLPALKTDIEGIVATWKGKFTELSQKPVKPAVKSALDETVTFLDQLAANANNPTALADAKTKMTDLSGKLTAACA
jgi:hypothetical protein